MNEVEEKAVWAIHGKGRDAVPELGKRYRINDTRKGEFEGVLKSVSGSWAVFVIVDGVASAICDYNVRYEGEEVACRDSLCTLTEVSS